MKNRKIFPKISSISCQQITYLPLLYNTIIRIYLSYIAKEKVLETGKNISLSTLNTLDLRIYPIIVHSSIKMR